MFISSNITIIIISHRFAIILLAIRSRKKDRSINKSIQDYYSVIIVVVTPDSVAVTCIACVCLSSLPDLALFQINL